MKRDLLFFGKSWQMQSTAERTLMLQLLRNRRVLLVAERCASYQEELSKPDALPANLIQIYQEPWSHLPLLRDVARYWFRRRILKMMQHHGIHAPILWIDSPKLEYLVGTLGEHKVVYFCKDGGFAPYSDLDNRMVNDQLEADLVAKVDLILTEDLLHAFRFPSHKTTQLYNFTTPMSTSLPRPRDLPHGRAIAGFYGPLDDRLDWELLQNVAKFRPDWHWVLIGPDQTCTQSLQLQALLQLKNVFWLGEKTVAEIQAYISHWQLLMLPYRVVEEESCYPAKLNEYLAIDKPMVMTRALPKLNTFMPLCSRVDSARTFAELLPMMPYITDESDRRSSGGWGQELVNQARTSRPRQIMMPWNDNPATLDKLMDSLA